MIENMECAGARAKFTALDETGQNIFSAVVTGDRKSDQ